MRRLNASVAPAPARPIRVLQYGEGNFLRAFVDDMLDVLNERTDWNGAVALVKPTNRGELNPAFREQENRYTVLLRGLTDNRLVEEAHVITSVADAVDPYGDYDRYAAYAKLDTLRFIVSNTTEAGIVLREDDSLAACPPASFPGKLCKLLYERAEHFHYAADKGVVILPTELIDGNGAELKRCVLALARRWNLGDSFERWVDTACVFASTLVDRIVAGYPHGEDRAIWEKLGYEDRLLVTAEPFALWVIEADRDLSRDLPFAACGLPVVFTDDLRPYRERKVRILNGAHTSFVPAAFQCGHDSVLDAMNDPLIAGFMRDTLRFEVLPTLAQPKDELLDFAETVANRFRNPYLHHALLAICLNSVGKWRARCMPSLLRYVEQTGELPPRLTFSLASLMSLYRGGTLMNGKLHGLRGGQPYELVDDAAVLTFFAETSCLSPAAQARAFLGSEAFFGPDLGRVPGLTDAVAASLEDILMRGMRTAMTDRFGG